MQYINTAHSRLITPVPKKVRTTKFKSVPSI